MRLKNFDDAQAFIEVIKECKGPVYLTDYAVDNTGEHNLRLNLKSTLSLYFGVSKLLEEHGDWFEIYTTNYEDETKIVDFMTQLEAKDDKDASEK